MKNILNVFRNKVTRKKILFTLLIFAVFKFGTTLTLPNITIHQISFDGMSILNMMNLFGGGALQSYSLFALGISPYITAGIIIQLLTIVIPYLSDLNEQGENGKRKIEKITRYVGFAMALVQAYMITYGFDKQYGILTYGTWKQYLYTTVLLTAGTMILVWFGDLITAYGVGNGTSMIIFAGIATSVPKTFVSTWNGIMGNGIAVYPVIKFIGYCLVYILLIGFTVAVDSAEKRIPIRSANGVGSNGSAMTFLPLKINTASVLPIIFAQSVLAVPQIIAGLFNRAAYDKLTDFLSLGNISGLLIYGFLILAFTFVYTYLLLDPQDMAKNLNKNNQFIPNVRAGADTATYIAKEINSVTKYGAIYITILGMLPYILSMVSSLSTVSALGGTGIIIMVGIAGDTMSQFETDLIENKYSYGGLFR